MERLDERIAELIFAGVMAGAYGALARELPEASRGLSRMREKWHARTAILAAAVAETAFPAVPR